MRRFLGRGVTSIAPRWEPAPLRILNRPKLFRRRRKFRETGVLSAKQEWVSVTFDQVLRSGFWHFLAKNALAPPTNYKTTMGADLKSFGLQVSLEPGKKGLHHGFQRKGNSRGRLQNDKGISLKPDLSGLPDGRQSRPGRCAAACREHCSRKWRGGCKSGHEERNYWPGLRYWGMETTKHGFHLFEGRQPVDLRSVTFTYSPDGKTFNSQLSAQAVDSL